MTTALHSPPGAGRYGGEAPAARPGSAARPGRTRPGRGGFSMFELMVALIAAAVLTMMAVPLTISALPYVQVRAEAKNAAAVMRQARLKAASTQRPTRVVLDCRLRAGNVREPCVFTTQTAAYTGGVLTGWDGVGISGLEGRHRMNHSVAVRAATGDAGASLFWIIFMPSSRTYSSPSPYELEFVPEKFKTDPARGVWALSVNNSSGRVTLARK